MKIIAGLGNPGIEYQNTPHSIGFEVVDAVARAAGVAWRESKSDKGALAEVAIAGIKAKLVKPLTFMNLSGDCVAPVLRYCNATVDDLIVVSDDIDLPVGRLRIRKGGSAGGHNGLKSIIERVGSPNFIRLRLGVGRDRNDRSKVVSHVLGKFDPESRKTMDLVVEAAVKALCAIVRDGHERAMNAYNGWAPPTEDAQPAAK